MDVGGRQERPVLVTATENGNARDFIENNYGPAYKSTSPSQNYFIEAPSILDMYRSLDLLSSFAIRLCALRKTGVQTFCVIYLHTSLDLKFGPWPETIIRFLDSLFGDGDLTDLIIITQTAGTTAEVSQEIFLPLLQRHAQLVVVSNLTNPPPHCSTLLEGHGATVQTKLPDQLLEGLSLSKTSVGAGICRWLTIEADEWWRAYYTIFENNHAAEALLKDIFDCDRIVKREVANLDYLHALSSNMLDYVLRKWDYQDSSYEIFHPVPEDQEELKSVYAPLHTGEIRVLILHSGSGETPIRVTLEQLDLDTKAQFEAVSYVVGERDESSSIEISIDNDVRAMNVSKTMTTLLKHFRQPWSDRRLWIDAICINQSDNDERSSQIVQMSQIFHSASHVRIWIGPESPEEKSDVAMSFIPEVLDLSQVDHSVRDSNKRDHWLALSKLMNRTWFRRRWVVQEMALARQATLHCGCKSIPWNDFADAAALFETKRYEIFHDSSQRQVNELEDVPSPGAASLVQISSNVFRKGPHGDVLEKLMGIETLLGLLPMFEVTEASDAVYAILNMGKDSPTWDSMKPDYKKPPWHVFNDWVGLIAQESGSLDVIVRPWAPAWDSLPTWIPSVAEYAFSRQSDGRYVRQNADPLVGIPGRRTYRACGEAKASTPLYIRIATDGSYWSVGVNIVGSVGDLGEPCVGGNIPEDWRVMAGWRDRHSPVPEAFWRTLVADRDRNGTNPPHWYSRACEFVFRHSSASDTRTSQILSSNPSSSVEDFLRRVQETTWNRRLFSMHSTNQQQRLGLCPPQTQTGDQVVILPGCSVPLVIRPAKDESWFGDRRSYLVGACFVHGIMDGEAANGFGKPKTYLLS